MEYICHRINTRAQLAEVPADCGVELDLRDDGNRLVLHHDPFSGGEDFEAYLTAYRHGTMILNIKSEGIEDRVLATLAAAGTVRRYFFLDCSFPMINKLANMGERNIAIRYSELEPLENALSLAGKVEWVWVDCFTRLPLDPTIHARLAEHFKICLVSPELQKHSTDRISEFASQLNGLPVAAVCTKRVDLWRQSLAQTAPHG